MNEYQKLLAYLKILYHNLTTLHRYLVKDPAWFGNHEQIGEWYEAVGDQIDDLAEVGISLGYQEPGIKDAVLLFGNECLTSEPRECKETFSLILGYFRSVAGLMQAAEPTVPASVTNKLQEYEYYWNKEANFKLAAALGEKAKGGTMVYDDDD